MTDIRQPYRGRLAPSPTGFLHLGHARTFWIAQQRCRDAGGTLILRNEDLDRGRCKPEFAAAMYEDLKWFGVGWAEGPDVGGPHAPYEQSRRRHFHLDAWRKLRDGGFIYPCKHSRKDVLAALSAPHEGEEEPVFPVQLRPASRGPFAELEQPAGCNWRFRVPDGEPVSFVDMRMGPQSFVAGRDFGDFIIWRNDDVPAYQLAVVVDDVLMRISEVVRGEDLLLSTARQLLLYRALGWTPPAFFHCELMRDETGARLAKRHDALSLRALRQAGLLPEAIRSGWANL